MAPTNRARATNDALVPTDLHATYYAQRASAGLIIAEGTWVSERAIGFGCVPGIYSERQAAAWSRVTGVVHALGGRIAAQLWHAGANSHPDLRGGALPAGPSAVNPNETCHTPAGRQPTVTPREMTAADIDTVLADYAAAARQARCAGFDVVEIAANGAYLIAQFLNPRLNLRADSFGRHRGRLLLEADLADAVSFSRLFIANPDLVSRFALGHDLAASDPGTHYRGAARGYVDYPIWPAA
jgi:N-ethylmaleimide reductase